jgi:hypothetical protein
VSLSLKALPAVTTHNVGLARHELTDVPVLDVRPQFHDPSAELVADDLWRLDTVRRPLVPRVDVKVCTANRCRLEFNLNFPHPGGRLRGVDDLDTGLRSCLRDGSH